MNIQKTAPTPKLVTGSSKKAPASCALLPGIH